MLIDKKNINAPCGNVSLLNWSDNKSFPMGALFLIIMQIGRISGIYKIQSQIKPERIYFGSSNNVGHRIATHKTELLHNRHRNLKLQRHCNKYGIDDLVFSVILECPTFDLVKNEQFYIDTYKPFFNISPTAESCRGCVRSAISRKRYSEAVRGRRASDETRIKQSLSKKGIIPWNKGIPWDEIRRKNISLGLTKGKPTKRQIKESLPKKYILQYDLDMNLIKEWRTYIEIERELGLNRKMISKYCNKNLNKSYYNFYFKLIMK